MKKIIAVLMLIFWMLLIFILSTEYGAANGKLSSKINYEVKAKTGISLEVKHGSFSLMAYIRKHLHFFEYTILGFLVYNVVVMLKVRNKYLSTLLIASFYAISDELHQYFVPDRTSSMVDVGIDVLGVLFAIGIILIIKKTRVRNRRSLNEG